jgi:hypothetical protein
MGVICLQIDAGSPTPGVRWVGAGALAVDARQVALAGVAAPAAVGFVVLEIDAERAALVLRAPVRLAGARNARNVAGARISAAPAVEGVRAGIDAGLAAFDRALLALLPGLALLPFGASLVPAGERGQRRSDSSSQQRSPRWRGEGTREVIESRLMHNPPRRTSIVARDSFRMGRNLARNGAWHAQG